MSKSRLDTLTPEQRRLLAQRLMARREAAADAEEVYGEGGEYPLSLGQERLWVLHRMHPESAAYNMSAAERVQGAFTAADLEWALDAVVRRHGALRTRFQERKGEGVQVVEPHRAIRLPYEDVSQLAPQDRESALRERAVAEAEMPFDLGVGPPFRARALRVGEDDHVLLFTIHHIVADGLSFGVLWRELGELLRSRAAGEPARLPPLRTSFGEFARRQRARLSGPAMDAAVRWWGDELAGAPHRLELPADLARPAARTGAGALARVELAPGLHERVWAFAAENGATPFMVLLAAAHALLGRCAGADDLLLGTAAGGRDERDVEGLIGFFANTLAIRGDLSGDPSFRTLTERVRNATLRAFDHAEVPFDRVVEVAGAERSPGWPPLVQAVFLAQLSPPGAAPAAPAGEAPLEADPGGAKFDLTLQVEQQGGATVARAEYATDLFRAATVERMLARYGVLLGAALADPDAPLSGLSLLGPEEGAWLAARERGPAAADRARSVHAQFAEQVALGPERVAVAWDGGEMTYGALDARSAAFAARLVAAGVRPGEAVGLLQARTPARVVAMLGVLRAGAAYLPLDPDYPEERLRFMLRDAGAARVVADPDLADRVPASAAEVVALPFEADAAPREPFRDVDPGPETLAYVVYTSGSTGAPKGVAVPHRGIVRLVRGGGFADTGEAERWLHLAPATFDAATLEVWAPLLNGGRLVLAPPGPLSPAELGAAIRRHGVTSLWLTAGLFHLVAAEAPDALAGVRQLLAGGDVLAPDRVAGVLEAHPSLRLVNGYGPTENTTFTACHTVGAADPARASVPIGLPVGGTAVYVLDRALRRVPPEMPGELCTAGAGLAWGYAGRAGATAERFLPDPYGPPGSRLYRTGDRARWTGDGVLEFLGRLDQQVKVRGFRIEPGEVEAALRALPGVRDAVAAARGDGAGKRLLAWVVAAAREAPDPAELRRALSTRLPAHMVPAAIAVVDAIPLTPNGKVDRRALPDPPDGGVDEAHVPPATPTEEIVAGIWAEVLGAARIGRGDDFFAIGGHSLLATQVASRVRDALGVDVPLRELFEAPALAEFAARVGAFGREAAAHPAPPLVRGEANDLPLSFAQERLWFIDRLEPGSPVYNMPFAVRMRGRLDVGALERSLGEVVRRHEALRTRFPRTDDGPVQRIEPFAGWTLPVEPLGAAAGREKAALAELRAGWAALPFDLAEGPVFRARLVRIAEDDHLLLLGLHHVAGDGWSMGIFWRETAALYAAEVRGETVALPLPPVRYADFAAWQRGWLAGEALARQVAWWREHLRGAPPLLELPTDRPRPPTQSHRGASHAFEVPPRLAEGLRALARREGATLFMVLLAAWDALLARWSGQDDVVVGTPVAGRTRREVEGVIGFFVNTLAMRGDLSGDPSFRALLARAREAALGAYAHQDLPFERLVEELHPERSLAHAPVFQAMLVLQNLPEEAMEPLPELEVSGEESGASVAKVDLAAGFVATPEGGLAAALEYAADLWEPETAARMAAHLLRLLEGAVADPDAAVAALPLLSPEERALAVAAGAATSRFPVADTLYARFVAAAERAPGAVAVTCGDERVTFGTLRARAERIGARLREQGAGPETVVGVALDRSPELVAALLGVLAAGAAYLPLDPADPPERLAYVLEDAGAPVVVTRGALADRLPARGAAVLLEEVGGANLPARFAPPPCLPDSLAYVIYTSGSTGRPKGVQVTHANVLRLMDATRAWFRPGAGDVWTLFHSYAFDFSVWELCGALLYGGRLVVVPRDVARAPAELLALLARERVTVLNQTPSAFRQLARADEEAAAAGAAPALALRLVVFGGEALDPIALRGWVDRRGTEAPRLVNMYGITETTVHVTYRPIGAADVRGGAASPIGVAIPDLSLHLLDPRGEPVPEGIRGELHVGGAGVARGYLGRSALTAARFVPDPFGAQPGGRLYRSGDLARRLPGGDLDYQGRADDQVKVRGFRIEPGEVEAALLAHPAVRAAVVLPRGAGDAVRLVAWTVADEEVPAAELRRHLRGLLPEHMVPGAFVAVDALPLTRNGKVDRRALPEPEPADGSEAEHLPPRTPTEQLLAGAWAELLGATRVGVLDRFFDLGGHSLLATRLVSRVRELLGVELPVRAVFEHPALGELAAEVDARLREGSGPAEPPLRPSGRDGDLPLSHAQERLWFVQRMEGDAPVYHMPFAYRLSGPIDADALGRAMAETVRRHASLRTVFPLVDGAPVQRILAPAGDVLRLHDLSGLAAEAREREAAALARSHAEDPFDLERGPLFRAALVRLAEDEHLLLLALHHVVADGWSTGVLLDELSGLYEAFAAGRPSPLADPALQYADFAAWQRRWLEGGAMERQLAYWRERLAGAPSLLELPTDRPRPAVQRHRGAAESAVLEGPDAEALRALARREGATLFMVLLAALDGVLARWSGQREVVVGTPVAGRTRAETERMIGLFLNSLAIRVDVGGQPTFRALLGRVREATLGAYAHQDVPFERVLEEVRPERSLGHTPVFQVMLNLANFGEGTLRLGDAEAVELGSGGALASKFDLTLYAGERAAGDIYLHLVYDADLFDAPRMREMLAQVVGVLAAAADDAAGPVAAIPLRTPGAALPDPAVRLCVQPWSGGVSERVAARARATPHAAALEDARERWSYGELDAAADRVAAGLAADGVRPGGVVAVWAHRSAPLAVALLGAWRAGAAFVVLDPAYPAARLAATVRAARPVALLRVQGAPAVPDEVRNALGGTAGGERVVGRGMLDEPASAESERVHRATDPGAVAYLAFTSGTTGAPKGIVGTHRPLAHFFGWYAAEMGIGGADRVSVLGGLAHDPLLRDLFAPLWSGGTAVFPDPEETGTPGYLAEWMRGVGVTVAHLTPATGELFAATAEGVQVPSLRLACFGGDRLRGADVRAFRAVAPRARVLNVYGATETPQVAAFHEVAADAPEGAIPVGRGIDGVQLLVLAPCGEPAGVAELGEVAVRTPYLATGYLDDAAATAARFRPVPWSGDPADRLYLTGDLGRYRPDGSVELAGRADRQVKVRGYRIEPAEVEAALRALPGVRDAVVDARGTDDDRRLVAWVTGTVPEPSALRALLRAALPEHAVPGAFVALDALPLTPNGKVDRAALPDPDAPLAAGRAAPATPTERALAAVWGELLRRPEVAANDDFFALGGHSLLATRLLARVRAVTGVELPLRTVFEHPVLAGLAAEVDRRAGERPAALPALVPAERGDTAPASLQQERMWFVDRLEGGGAVYHMPSAHHFAGPLDAGALGRALDALAGRHEALRTALPEGPAGLPVQRILPPAPVPLPLHDLSALADAERAGAFARRAAEHAAAPFDLERGPLFRAALVRLGADDHVLLLNLHHAVSDGWSNRLLVRELTALYEAFRAGMPSPLPEPPLQYADYAIWQRAWLAASPMEREAAFWRASLAGAPPLLALPADRPRPPVPSHRGGSEALVLDAATLGAVRRLAEAEGATLFMALQAAFATVLARWARTDDVVVGTPVAGRTRPELESVAGLFLNTLALRTRLDGSPSYRALLGRVRASTLAAFAHQELPFERVLEVVRPPRSLAHAPVFQVMLNLLEFADGETEAPAPDGTRVSALGAAAQLPAKFDLTLYAAPGTEGLALHLVYATDLFDAPRMRALLETVAEVLRAGAADPERPAAALAGDPPEGILATVPDDASAAPRGGDGGGAGVERAVAAAWGEVLGIDPGTISPDADFFDLGGHSLRATQVLARLRDALGVRLPIRAFFTAPTVRGLAAAVRAAGGAERTVAAEAPGEEAWLPGVYPLSFAQQRLWVLMRLGAGAEYHMGSALRLQGALDEWALERALEEVVRRHEPLRTRIETRDGEPVQAVQPPRPLRLRAADATPAPGERVEEMLPRLAAEEAARPFAEGGPYFRVRLLRIAPDDHLLLWTTHHLVSDGWSAGILRGELGALYGAFSRGEESPLAPLASSYGAQVLAERRALSGARLEELVGWWREHLAGAPPLLEVPTDRPRPPEASGRGGALDFTLAPGSVERVAAFARSQGATPFMVLFAAWSAVLARWSGQDDVVVGIPVANRATPEAEALVGFFAGTLALRTRLDGAPPFAALVGRVREATLGAFEHADLPFERLVEALNPARSLAHAPVFQAMFAFQNVPRGGTPAGEALVVTPVGRPRTAATHDLSLVMADQEGVLRATLEYATDLFEGGTASRLAEAMGALLEAGLAEPETPVDRLPLAGGDPVAETRPVPDASAPPEVLHHLFERHAARAPDATALVWGGGALTYGALDRRSAKLARRLRGAGVPAGAPVAVLAKHSPEAVAALLGVLKAGCAFLPLDPEAPAERTAFTLADAGAAAVLADPRLAARLPDGAPPVLALGEDGEDAPPVASPSRVDPDTVAYVLYTSGSTGRPKGVAVTHRAAAAHLASLIECFALGAGDRVLSLAALTFDPWVETVLAALTCGASVALRAPEVWSPAELAEAAGRMEVTVLDLPTAYWHYLAADPGPAGSVKRAVRLVVVGGESMRPEAAVRWAALPGAAVLLNTYGPTEAVVTATAWEVDGRVAEDAARLPVGTPLPGRVARVLDGAGLPVPSGVPGELHLGGAALAAGYAGRPAATAASFVPDPWAGRPGARLYRTGDRVRRRADDTLEFLGRVDLQVKVRGFRVEPGEVEAVLREAPGVRDAAVVARVGPAGDGILAAYVVPSEDRAPDPAALRRHCAARLPEYLVPAAIVVLPELPLTPNGKVDGRALPAPGAGAGDGYVVPRDVVELEVARIWAAVLGVPRAGAADDFFRLGGHSLVALRMLAQVRERFGRDLPLAAVFRHSTVAAFAAVLRSHGGVRDAEGLAVPLRDGPGTPLFLFPPAGGTVTHYAELARLLEGAAPVHALQAPGVAGEEAALEDAVALARRFVEELRRVQPRGPYRLGGWSAGGVTAFAAAALLEDEGETVELLALLDAPAPDGGVGDAAPTDRAALLRGFARSTVAVDDARLDALEASLRAAPRGEETARLAAWMARHGADVADDELTRVARVVEVFAATARALRDYRPTRPYRGRALLLVAEDGVAEEGFGPDALPARWRPHLAGEVEVRVVPGAHARLVLDPAVAEVARALGEVLTPSEG